MNEIYAFNTLCLKLEKMIQERPILGIAVYYRFKQQYEWMTNNGRPGKGNNLSGRKDRKNKRVASVVDKSKRASSKSARSKVGNVKVGGRPANAKASKRGSK